MISSDKKSECLEGAAHHWMIDLDGMGICCKCKKIKRFAPTVIIENTWLDDKFSHILVPFYDTDYKRKVE